MRTTVDIPEPLYREMKIKAATDGTTVREIILESIEAKLRNQQTPRKKSNRSRFPTLKSRRPGSLQLGDEGVYEFIPFP